jgi:hypothetical protein
MHKTVKKKKKNFSSNSTLPRQYKCKIKDWRFLPAGFRNPLSPFHRQTELGPWERGPQWTDGRPGIDSTFLESNEVKSKISSGMAFDSLSELYPNKPRLLCYKYPKKMGTGTDRAHSQNQAISHDLPALHRERAGKWSIHSME